MSTFKLLSLNMHCKKEENYEQKFETIVEFIQKESPDIIVLQECVQSRNQEILVNHRGVEIKKDNMVLALLNRLDDSYDYYFNWGGYGFEVLEEGLAIITKYKIESYDSRYVSKSKSENDWWSRKLIRVGVMINKQLTYIYSVHLGWWHDENDPFKEQVNQLNNWVLENPDARHLMVGDFNNPAGQAGYQHMMKDLQFSDLYYEANPDGFYDETFINKPDTFVHEQDNASQRIDYLMSKGMFEVIKINRIFDGINEPIVSDHYGLMAYLK